MAVYKRNYTHYDGPITPERWRFTVMPRYLLQTVFESKMITSFFTACFIPHLMAMALIYLLGNPALIQLLNLDKSGLVSFVKVDGSFFQILFTVESYASFFIVALIGPNLIAPDLANNALPLYLSRPFTRTEYVIGKLTVLLALTSLMTWIPGMLLVGIQTNMAGFSWLSGNMRIPAGIFVGSWVWILTISLTALAVSAWVKLKPLAIVSLFFVFFVAAGFGAAANDLLNLSPRWGTLLSLPTSMRMVWAWLLNGETLWEPRTRFGSLVDPGLPTWSGLAAMLAISALCLLLLSRKVRAVEVVR